MKWISCKEEHPKYNEFVLFCLDISLKTVYLGWRENKISIKDNEDMWFAEGFGYWFTEKEVLGWCRFPNTDSLLTSRSSRTVEDGQAEEPPCVCSCTPNKYCKIHGGGKPPSA